MKFVNENFDLSDEEKKEATDNGNFELNDDVLFDEKNFQTLVIQTNENKESKESKQILDVDKFIQQYQNFSEKNDLLAWLKKNNYKNLLLEQVEENKNDARVVHQLICAYWEAGFSDPKDILVFIPYLLSDNFNISLEAYTAINSLDKAFDKKEAETALQMIEDAYNELSSDTIIFVDEIKDMLKNYLSESE